MHDEVVVWFAELSHADRTKAIFAIDRLEHVGHAARMPHSKALGDGLFELRFALDNIAQRITYRYRKTGALVLLTKFHKTKNNDRTEVTRARIVADECAQRNP